MRSAFHRHDAIAAGFKLDIAVDLAVGDDQIAAVDRRVAPFDRAGKHIGLPLLRGENAGDAPAAREGDAHFALAALHSA
jgi:hypothetical protein